MKIALFLLCFSWIFGIKILTAGPSPNHQCQPPAQDQTNAKASFVEEEEKMSAAHAKNTTEQHILGLEKLGFDSDIVRQIALSKILAEHVRAYIVAKVNDAKVIDQYNALTVVMNQFIGDLVLKISQNNHFEERKSPLFYEKKTKEWLEIQGRLEALIKVISEDAFTGEVPEIIKNFAPDAKTLKDKVLFYVKEFRDSGEEAVRDVLTFTVNSMESFITEKKSPVNQQTLIEYLNARLWLPIAKSVKRDVDDALGVGAHSHAHTHQAEGGEKGKENSQSSQDLEKEKTKA